MYFFPGLWLQGETSWLLIGVVVVQREGTPRRRQEPICGIGKVPFERKEVASDGRRNSKSEVTVVNNGQVAERNVRSVHF